MIDEFVSLVNPVSWCAFPPEGAADLFEVCESRPSFDLHTLVREADYRREPDTQPSVIVNLTAYHVDRTVGENRYLMVQFDIIPPDEFRIPVEFDQIIELADHHHIPVVEHPGEVRVVEGRRRASADEHRRRLQIGRNSLVGLDLQRVDVAVGGGVAARDRVEVAVAADRLAERDVHVEAGGVPGLVGRQRCSAHRRAL